MISHDYKCIFIHIPKAAGQSIENVFLTSLGLDWNNREKLLLKSNTDPDKGPPRLAHLTAEEYVRCNYISSELFDSYFKFTFVRNPWARIVSEYKYRYSKQYDFNTFLYEKFPQVGDDCYEKFTAKYRHIIPQYDFLFDRNGKQLVDFIGRFENIQEDFNLICQKTNIPQQILPHKNKSSASLSEKIINKIKPDFFKVKTQKKIKYTEYYDQKSRNYVAKLYNKDIETFKYQFED